MSAERDSIHATSTMAGAPDANAQPALTVGEFLGDMLLIGVFVVGAIIFSNLWSRKRD